MTLRQQFVRLVGVSVCAVALTACGRFDGDFRGIGGGLDTSDAAASRAAAPRPEPNALGLITYPNYQVAIARRGDTVSDVARRVGVRTGDLASHNGIRDGVPLREGETLVLPAAANPGITPSEADIASVAGAAIQRADGAGETSALGTTGPEPQQHRVVRGETAFSIARIYGVTPRALADWNGLGDDLEVREGQILLIPVVVETAAAGPVEATALPGVGSTAPEPPSATEPLPVEDTAGAEPAPAPPPEALAEERTQSSELLMPVQGPIIRAFKKEENNGIDIAAAAGTPVKAAEAGTVAAISRDTNGILAIVIKHPDDLLTVYFGVEDETVAKDASVTRGQTIGKVRSGDPTFLHFEVRRGFDPLDPEPFLN